MDLNSVQVQMIQKVLFSLPLEEEELITAEDYIFEGKKEDRLKEIAFRDLSEVEISERYFGNFPINIAKRIFRVLFQIGESTCSGFFLVQNLIKWNQELGDRIEPEQLIALHVQDFVYNVSDARYRITAAYLKDKIEKIRCLASGQAEAVLGAVKYYKGKDAIGKLYLLTVYFLLKYPFAGIGTGDRVMEEDSYIIMQYEEIFLRELKTLFFQITPEEWKQILDGIQGKGLSQEFLELAKGKTVDRKRMFLLAWYAFLNCGLSNCLKNSVILFLRMDQKTVLKEMEDADCRQAFEHWGKNFDRVFELDGGWYISWAAEHHKREILQEQLMENREKYLYCCDREQFGVMLELFDVMRQEEPKLYQEKWKEKWERIREEIVQQMVTSPLLADLVRNYLLGKVGIEQIVEQKEQIRKEYKNRTFYRYWSGYWLWRGVVDYSCLFEEVGFFNRCLVCIFLGGDWNFLETLFFQKTESKFYDKLNTKGIKQIFFKLDTEGLPLSCQLDIVNVVFFKEFLLVVKEVFLQYLSERRKQTLEAFFEAEAFGRCIALELLEKEAEKNKEIILKFFQDRAKTVQEKLFSILCRHIEWEEEIEEFLYSKKAAERVLAIRVLGAWNQEQYRQKLREVWEKEKSAKVQELLRTILWEEKKKVFLDTKQDRKEAEKKLLEQLFKGGKKRILAWACQTPFPLVHKKNGEEASEEYLQGILLCYAAMDSMSTDVVNSCRENQEAIFLTEELAEQELADYLKEWFRRWVEAKADRRRKYVLYAAVMHGDMELVVQLQDWILKWAVQGRGILAAEAVRVLACCSLPCVWYAMDRFLKEARNRLVREAAEQELSLAAKRFGISREELTDRLVPNFGFDKKRELILDYGERKFTAVLTLEAELEVYNTKGKRLKNLPAPRKRDRIQKAEAVYKQWKLMRTQIKKTTDMQKIRMEKVFFTRRKWKAVLWKEIFIENPMMHVFAVRLIWGVYQEQKLIQSFRYMEDGTFTTAQGEEWSLPSEGQIGLVHPIEFSKEQFCNWREQMADYEIVQPIKQLEREVFVLRKEEMEETQLKRFEEWCIERKQIYGLLEYGWKHGFLKQADYFYREDFEAELGVKFSCRSLFHSLGELDKVVLDEMQFYFIKRESISEKEKTIACIKEANYCKLKEVPVYYFSEIVRQISLVIGFAEGKDNI